MQGLPTTPCPGLPPPCSSSGGTTSGPRTLHAMHCTLYVQPGVLQLPLPPVAQTMHCWSSHGPAQGFLQTIDLTCLPPCSTTLYLQPLLSAPRSSIILHFFASSLPSVGAENHCCVSTRFKTRGLLLGFLLPPAASNFREALTPQLYS